jgi:dihydropteroate synthase
MGVVNVTPDSFSDGGLFLDPDAAIAHGLQLIAQGADILDIGGESTRPGAEPVSEAEELRRVLPVVAALAERGQGGGSVEKAPGSAPAEMEQSARDAGDAARVQISIDTSKAAVAAAALAVGATLVNDVTALRGDLEMAAVVAQGSADCCLMHMRGDPQTMQHEPHYDDVVDEVKAFLDERLAYAVREGIAEQRVLLDPGFLGRLLAATDPGERLSGTLATNVIAYQRGARVFRVHDVAPVRAALTVAAATLSGTWT